LDRLWSRSVEVHVSSSAPASRSVEVHVPTRTTVMVVIPRPPDERAMGTAMVPSPSRTLVPIPLSNVIQRFLSERNSAFVCTAYILYCIYKHVEVAGTAEGREGRSEIWARRQRDQAVGLPCRQRRERQSLRPCSVTCLHTLLHGHRYRCHRYASFTRAQTRWCFGVHRPRLFARSVHSPATTHAPALARIVVRSSSQSRPPRIGRQKRTLYLKTRSPSTGIMQIGWSARAPRSTRRT